jgi:hypothetical protein
MIRNVGTKSYLLGATSSFIAIMSILITVAAPAQTRWTDRSTRESFVPPELEQFTGSSQAKSRVGAPGIENIVITQTRSQRSRLEKPMNDPFPPLFLPAVTLDSGGMSPNDVTGPVVVADLNGDGKLDMVMPNPCAPEDPVDCTGLLSVFLGNGDGTFQPAVSYSSGAFWAASVAIADVNNDNKLDLVVANTAAAGGGYGAGVVSVLLGNGDGTFQQAVTYDSGGLGATSVAVGDLNRDGKLDLVVSNNSTADSGEGSVAVLLGNGDGTFQMAVPYDSGGWGTGSVVLTDINGDGKLDVLISDVCTPLDGGCDTKGAAGVLLGNGDGTLKPVVTYDSGGYTAVSVAVADLNHDAKFDLITFNFCNTGCTGGGIGVLLGNGDGTYRPAVTYLSGGAGGLPGMAAVADFDGDGKLDIVANTTTPSGSGLIGVLLGNGDGSFKTAVTYDPHGALGTSVTSADLTGHHRADLIVTECPVNGCGNGDLRIGLLLHVGSVATNTLVISSLNPSVFGQTVTLTATVSSSSGKPSGTVEFFDNSLLLGTGTLANGSTSISLASLGAASHSITAVYQGSLKFNSSISQPLDQVVAAATTMTSLTSSSNPIIVNHSVIYTATVSSQTGGPISGTVTFSDGSVQYSAGIVGNQATVKIKYRTAGVHTTTANYSGDANNAGSTSGPLTEKVQAVTITQVTTSDSPSLAGQSVTFTATVSSTYGMIPNGELLTFLDGKHILGSVPLSGGIAAFTTSSLSAKTHTIEAVYNGDTIFKTSTGRVTQVVKPN